MKHLLPLALICSLGLALPTALLAEEEAPLHSACGSPEGAEQQAVPAPAEETEARSAGHGELAAAAADLERQLQAALDQEDVDQAFACSLLAFHRALAAMAGVQAEHGEEQAFRDATEHFLTDIEEERQQLIQWLERQEQ